VEEKVKKQDPNKYDKIWEYVDDEPRVKTYKAEAPYTNLG
jgi:hypothetical protein